MILPIVAYGHPILRKVAEDIDASYPDLDKLIANMWETMYGSNGVGIAAPQINRSIRLFVVDTVQVVESAEDDEKDEYKDEKPVKQVFINAQVVSTSGAEWPYEEGCLSIPRVREDVYRAAKVKLRYMDEKFVEYEKEFDGLTARVILHEYDHLEGKLFVDYLKPLKKRLIKSRLDDITKGKVRMDYRMLFYQK
jgi:peptide deformylase